MIKQSKLSIKCEKFLNHNEVNCCNMLSDADEGSFNPSGCDCCKGLANTTYECIGYAPKLNESVHLGEICGECLNYFYNGES